MEFLTTLLAIVTLMALFAKPIIQLKDLWGKVASPSKIRYRWKFSQQFTDDVFPSLSGAQVMRIATHLRATRCQLIPTSRTGELLKLSSISCGNRKGRARKDLYEMVVEMNNVCDDLCGAYYVKLLSVQKGVLRMNCVDYLDRTNVGPYVYGRVALAHQLHVLGFVYVDNINIDSHSPIAHDLMQIYKEMRDVLAPHISIM
ncbi:hypothetical protein FXO38_11576 [Capsicum annuum]|uniref:SAC domain-containing protein n=1 Tax=Capsicum annuum TaxID=4072 RepID=A0A2G3A537_CAPAN|nr:hypothetical protein FXO37_27953 [Capsicum annuum]KAF3661654.1 hypothetical protein FXO38_11576 [Capsicum annuum]PHT89355.1 hypothetical protein T459_04468 [Capsicum annuum]